MPRLSITCLVSCALATAILSIAPPAFGAPDRVLEETLPDLPEPVSNNAVALIADEDGYHLYSMLGVKSGKSWRDASSDAMHFSSATGNWQHLEPVPGVQGRLAASAIVVGNELYIFGGYTVDEDGSEQSTRAVHRLHRESGQWQRLSDMPVAVEDSVLLAYQDRYIYLLSGWHDLGNVNLVQVLDTKTGNWLQATPYPGKPVFGHAGGISGNRFLICDGVRIEYAADPSPRKFLPADDCWLGEISPNDYRSIAWRSIGPHPGLSRYRMAAGDDGQGRIFFAGGSVNPYNFNGIGYDGVASQPESGLFSYIIDESRWECHGNLSVATMDHRGLPRQADWFYIIGGMRDGQEISAGVLRFRPDSGRPCAD